MSCDITQIKEDLCQSAQDLAEKYHSWYNLLKIMLSKGWEAYAGKYERVFFRKGSPWKASGDLYIKDTGNRVK